MNKLKILLIRPPFEVEKYYFPRFIKESLGLESLASFISPNCDVKILDAVSIGWNKYWESKEYPNIIFQGLTPSKIEREIKKYKPDMVGINWLFSTQNGSVNMIINIIKKIDKNITILVGGSYPSTNPEDVLSANKNIDIAVFGEGEMTLQEVLKSPHDLSKINGLAYREGENIIINQPRSLVTNLDDLPIPYRNFGSYKNYSKQNLYKTIYSHLKKIGLNYKKNIFVTSQITSLPFICDIYYYFYNKNKKDKLPSADISTSRGCPNRCTFCAIHNIWGHTWRSRTAENVLEEIDILVKKYGIRHINIVDDNFNVSKTRVIDICKGIVKNNYNITISASSGVYIPTLDEDVLTWLKKAGLNYIRLSIESGNSDVLHNIIKKNINLNSVKNIVDICKKLKIHTEGCFIFGIPGEKIENMEETLSFSKKCGFERVVKFIFQPFPNTELYKLCLEKNYLTKDYDKSKLYATGNKCYVKTNDFSPEDVLRIVDRKF